MNAIPQLNQVTNPGFRPFSAAVYCARSATGNPDPDRPAQAAKIPDVMEAAGIKYRLVSLVKSLIKGTDWHDERWQTGEEILVRVSNNTLKDRMNCSKSTVQRAISEAYQAGYIDILPPEFGNGQRIFDLSLLLVKFPEWKARAEELRQTRYRSRAATGEIRKAMYRILAAGSPEIVAEARKIEARARDCPELALKENLAARLLEIANQAEARWLQEAGEQEIETGEIREKETILTPPRVILTPGNSTPLNSLEVSKDTTGSVPPDDPPAPEKPADARHLSASGENGKPEHPGKPETMAKAVKLLCAVYPDFRIYLQIEGCDPETGRVTMAALRNAGDRLRRETGYPVGRWAEAIRIHGPITTIAALVAARTWPAERRRASPAALLAGMLRKAPYGPEIDRKDCLNPWPTLWARKKDQQRESGRQHEPERCPFPS